MGTPRKSFGQSLESPYAQHLQQYPSQSEGYIPNEFGGKNRVPTSTPSKQQHHQGNNNYPNNNSNQWRRGNNRYFNANRGAGSSGNNSGGGGGGGYRNNYQKNFQNNYNPQQTNRHSNSGNRQQPYHGHKNNKFDNCSKEEYYHPSMMVDPWKELLDRHNAIRNSQIDTPLKATPDNEDASDSNDGASSPKSDAITEAIPTTAATPTTSVSD